MARVQVGNTPLSYEVTDRVWNCYSDGCQYYVNLYYRCPGGTEIFEEGRDDKTQQMFEAPNWADRWLSSMAARCPAPAAPTPDPTCADCNAGVVDTHTTPAATQAPATSAPPPRPSASPTPAVSAPSAPALGFLGNTTPVGGAPVWIVAVAALLLARKVKLL